MLQLEITPRETSHLQAIDACASQSNQEWLPMLEHTLLRDLMQVGYLAVGRGCFTEARSIFQGLIAMRPASEIPLLGLAVTEMSAGNFAKADEFMAAARLLQPSAAHTLAIDEVLQHCRDSQVY